jgi:predicted nucleotidyltransferase
MDLKLIKWKDIGVKSMNSNLEHLSALEISSLKEIKRKVSAIFNVRQFILFGSKARGNFSCDSDVDILIVTENKLSWQEERLMTKVVFEVNLVNGTTFSLMNVDADSWANGIVSVLPFHDNVEKEGVEV